jgi:hypothetical protein
LLSQRSSLRPLRILRPAQASAVADGAVSSEAARPLNNAAEHRATREADAVDAAVVDRAEFNS